ncbi:MAG: hypothetical protein IKQ91_09645 [Oscillospiraceae bacterium]|nr:hypothetical protein [Oscillospiraceae bacterium]
MKDKRKGKLLRHFPVYINGKKCQVMRIRIEGDGLALLTKIHNPNLYYAKGEFAGIRHETDAGTTVYRVEGTGKAYHSPQYSAYYYRLIATENEP